MAMRMYGNLRGDDVLIRKLHPPRLIGPPSHDLARSFGEIARDFTKAEVPRDTDELYESIDFAVSGGAIAEWARVTVGADHGPYVHEGTRPHFPPIAAITAAANRRGIPPFLFARAIARRGTPPNPFLRRGFARAEKRLGHLMTIMARQIERRFASG